ncbi:MAG: putative transposase, partial [Pseudoalteromonas tetraodonis]
MVDQASRGITNEDDMAEAMKLIRKSLYEQALNAELDDHLDYQKHAASGADNTRNGQSSKTVYSDSGALEIQMPRDRNGDFEPQAIKKRQARLPLMDAKIIYLYSKGMSTREISE